MNDPIELAAIERGAGPPVALVHGGVIHSGPAWAASIGPLAQAGLRVLAVDRRGHGRSDAGDADYIPVHLHADDLRLTLELRDAKQVHLVGTSYGAVVCLEFALCWPDRVRSLTLCEPSILTLVADDPDYRPWVAKFEEVESRYKRGADLEEWFPDWLRLIDQWLADRSGQGTATWPMVERQAHLIFKEEPGWRWKPDPERLSQMEVPTLIINGAWSEPPLQEVGELLASMIRGASHAWIERAGHDAHARRPEVFNEMLISFVKATDPEARD